jgi:uncharacterized membrane-anchored protein
MQPQTNDVKAGKTSVLLWILPVLIFSLAENSFGQQQLSNASRPNPVNWIVGPAKANLGDYAEIVVPEGYRFAGPEDARIVLMEMNNPAPKALAGIMAPVLGKWMVVFEFTETGYVPNDGNDEIDSQTVLSKMQEKLQRQSQQNTSDPGSVSSVQWELEPQYNRTEHSLEWAIRAETGSVKAVNHVLRLFGREGVLDGIAVQPSHLPADTIPLKKLMAGVSFKPGHTYTDYQKGDRISRHSLADLIATDDSSDSQAASVLWIWGSAGTAVVLIGIGTVAFRKRARRQKKSHWPTAEPVHTNGFVKSILSNHESHVNGNGNGTVNGHRSRRRRIFDYQKYYSDLLFQVSDRTYEMDSPKPAQNGSVSTKHSLPDHVNQTTLAANLGLIESQKHLIEEQQRLIREQTKLIEEKTRLIHEKNQVLEKQAELFGNNVF